MSKLPRPNNPIAGNLPADRFWYEWARAVQSLIDTGVLSSTDGAVILARLQSIEDEGSASDLIAALRGENGISIFGDLASGVVIQGPTIPSASGGGPPGRDGEDGQDSFIPGPKGDKGEPGRDGVQALWLDTPDDAWPTNAPDRALTAADLAAATLSGLTDAVDDAAAATAGVAVNGLYRTGSILKVRVA